MLYRTKEIIKGFRDTINKNIMLESVQEYLHCEYSKFWDWTMVEFLNEVAKKTDEDETFIFYDVITFKYGEDTLTLQGSSTKDSIFKFKVDIFNKDNSISSVLSESIKPAQTLAVFVKETLPILIYWYEEHCDEEIENE